MWSAFPSAFWSFSWAADFLARYGMAEVISVGILLFCGLYWSLTMKLIPHWMGYKLKCQHLTLPHGERLTVLAKVRPDGVPLP